MNRVCVIGAGPSGIVAAKVLAERDVPFDGYELGSDVGGIWRIDNDNGRSAAYDSLRMDTSKERVAFSDHPMPEEYPDYPTHEQVLAYLEGYVDRFDLRRGFAFRSRVDRVVPAGDGGYEVTVTDLDDGSTETTAYRAVLVCTGHHWDPAVPDLPGTFSGRALHSREYRRPDEFAGRSVLVMGIGNSGADIACEVSGVARRTVLSTRRSNHVVPRYVLGRPTDKWVTPLGSRLPLRLQRAIYRLLLRVAVGPQERYGVPAPDHALLSSHPTISDDLLRTVAAGRIEVKPDVEALSGDAVRFADGSEERVDVVVYATGYRISFPFLGPDVLSVPDNEVRLYRNVVHPGHPGLYFVGLIQPLGAIMPLCERQAEWIACLLSGECTLPDRETMERAIARDRAARSDRYVDSPRHTIQVDYFPYQRLLRREVKRGRRRARAGRGIDVSLPDDRPPVEA